MRGYLSNLHAHRFPCVHSTGLTAVERASDSDSDSNSDRENSSEPIGNPDSPNEEEPLGAFVPDLLRSLYGSNTGVRVLLSLDLVYRLLVEGGGSERAEEGPPGI